MNIVTTHSATARVQLTVEVEVGSKWGADCSIKQVHEQAEQEARGALRNLFQKAEERRMRVIGEPVISAVVVANKAP